MSSATLFSCVVRFFAVRAGIIRTVIILEWQAQHLAHNVECYPFDFLCLSLHLLCIMVAHCRGVPLTYHCWRSLLWSYPRSHLVPWEVPWCLRVVWILCVTSVIDTCCPWAEAPRGPSQGIPDPKLSNVITGLSFENMFRSISARMVFDWIFAFLADLPSSVEVLQ